jgi:hypothetical protein
LQFLAEDRPGKLKLLAKEERQTETISDPAEENRWTLLPREQWKVAQRGDITQYCSSDVGGVPCVVMRKSRSKSGEQRNSYLKLMDLPFLNQLLNGKKHNVSI